MPLITYCPHCDAETETRPDNICVECFRDKSKPATLANYHPPSRTPDDYTREVVANEAGRFAGCLGCLAPFALGFVVVGLVIAGAALMS